MVDIYDGLYVGDDADYEKIKSNSDWRSAECVNMVGRHQQLLGTNTFTRRERITVC